MQGVRHLLAQRWLAAALLAAALLLKLLVPGGYMIASDHGRLSIIACSGTGPVTPPMTMHGDMAGHGTDDGESKDHGKAEMPCTFAGLSSPALGAIDPVQLASLVAFILALGLVLAILPMQSRRIWLRPPLRGPPLDL